MTADVVTAADLEAMTPEQRAEVIRGGFVDDPSVLSERIQELRRQQDARLLAGQAQAS